MQSFPFKELGLAGSEYYNFPAQPVVMPLKLSPSGTPVIAVWINGQKENFWLDSGTTFSVVSSELARQISIMPINQNMVSASTGTDKKVMVQIAVIESIKIGALEIANHPAMIIRMQDLFFKIPGLFRGFGGRRINKIFEVSGILGMNAIKNLNIRIDFKNKKIIITKPENKRPAERNLFWLGYPIVICRSMDGIPLYFGLDTGAKKSILSNTILSKLSPLATNRARMKVWGAGGFVKINAQVLPALKIKMAGHIVSFKNITTMQLHQFGLVRLDGILGMDFSMGCSNLTIDLQNGILALNSDH
jgi:predicted aspartyl protease